MPDAVVRWGEEVLSDVYVEDFAGKPDWFEIVVRTEVPFASDGTRLPRRGNRYWPTTIHINGEFALSSDARSLGDALIAAADLADATDSADSLPCGHWVNACDGKCGEADHAS